MHGIAIIGMAIVSELFKKDMKGYYGLYLISININDYEFSI